MAEHGENEELTTGLRPDVPDGFSQPRPLRPPPTTFWPFVTAVGLAMVFWGVTLNLLVICVGGGVFLIGMIGLIGDWVREHRHEST